MKGARQIFFLSRFIPELRKAKITETIINDLILCIKPKQRLTETYYCLCPQQKKTSFPKTGPRFFLFYLSSKFLKQDRTVLQLSRTGVFVAQSRGTFSKLLSMALRARRCSTTRKSSRGGAWEGCKPGTARADRLPAADSSLVELHPAFWQK